MTTLRFKDRLTRRWLTRADCSGGRQAGDVGLATGRVVAGYLNIHRCSSAPPLLDMARRGHCRQQRCFISACMQHLGCAQSRGKWRPRSMIRLHCAASPQGLQGLPGLQGGRRRKARKRRTQTTDRDWETGRLDMRWKQPHVAKAQKRLHSRACGS